MSDYFLPTQEDIASKLRKAKIQDKVIPQNQMYFQVYGSDKIMLNQSNVMKLTLGCDSQFQRWLMDRYTDMVYKDTFIGHCVEMRASFVKTLNSEILNKNPNKQLGQVHSEFIEKNLFDNIDFDRMLRDILRTSMIYGFSVVEKLFELKHSPTFGMKYELTGLNSVYPAFIGFDIDLNTLYYKDGFYVGRPVNLTQKRNKFIVHSYRPDFQNPYGNSILTESIYYLYWMRQEMLLKWFEYVIKFGSPIIYGTFPELGTDPHSQDVQQLVDSLEQMRSGFVAAIPEIMTIQQLKLDLGSSKETFVQFWQSTELEISNSILYNTMSAENTSYGSYAKNTIYDQIQNTLFFADSKDVASAINQQVIKHLIDVNYGEQDYYPYLEFNSKEDKSTWDYARTLKTLQEMGMPITESFIMDRFNIPKNELGDTVLKPIPKTSTNPSAGVPV